MTTHAENDEREQRDAAIDRDDAERSVDLREQLARPTVVNMNMDVIETRIADNVVYLRIPRELQRAAGVCECAYCKAHPNDPPMWDTLAVPTDGKHERAFTVHMPEGRGRVTVRS
jgi:hypothetical protein